MGSRKNRICVWKRNDTEKHEAYCAVPKLNLPPDCREHEHITWPTALVILNNKLFTRNLPGGEEERVYEATGPFQHEYTIMLDGEPITFERRVIVMTEAYHWGIKESAGMCTHQLVHG